MNKLTTAVVGIALFFSTLFIGTSAFAATPTCAEIGRTVYQGEPEYLPKLDKDADGAICERKTITIQPVQGTPAPETPAAQTPASGQTPSAGQTDANGNPVKLDSNGNPIQTDANGNPIQDSNLANTGFTWYWATLAAALITLGVFLYRHSLRLMK